MNLLQQAFREGWETAADWANRLDLFEDIWSPTLQTEMKDKLYSVEASIQKDVTKTDFWRRWGMDGKSAASQRMAKAAYEEALNQILEK